MSRISDHAKPRGIRFKKKVDKEITAFCITHEIRPSTLIQMAVECFLRHGDCLARNKLLKDTL